MEQRVSIITLGVTDISNAAGNSTSASDGGVPWRPVEGIVFFQVRRDGRGVSIPRARAS